MVRIQPGPPHGQTSWGISSAGRAPALQAGGRRFDPDILHHHFLLRLIGCVVHLVADPSGCRDSRRAILVCHASGCCSLTIYRNRIEIVDGKSAGVKAFRRRAVSDIMIASTDIFIFEVCEYDEFDRQTRNTQILTIQSVISVLDDVTLVG